MNQINYQLLQQVHQLKPIVRTQMLGVGTYLPSQRVKSDDIMQEIDSEKNYGIPHDWMSKQMGIIERRMVSDETLPSDLAIAAAQDALDSCPDFNPDLIDAVIFCGIERDRAEPSTAHTIQNALNLKANHVFDVANACFGFFEGLKLSSALVEAGLIEYGLVVTGEVSTKMCRVLIEQLKQGMSQDKAKHLWGMLSLGDAGGAIIVGPSPDGQSGFMKFNQRSESRHVNLCSYEWKHDGKVEACMHMGEIVARGCKLNEKVFYETINELEWDDVDWAISHQTGEANFKKVLTLENIEEAKVIKTYPKLGNITTATLPASFQKLTDSGTLTKGDRIAGLFAGSGLVAGQFGYVV